MIFINTESLIARFGFKSFFSYENGCLSLISLELNGEEKNTELIELLLSTLNSRLAGDSINYELSITKILPAILEKGFSSSEYQLAAYLALESDLINYVFDDDKVKQNLEIIKSKLRGNINDKALSSVPGSDLLKGALALNFILYGNLSDANEVVSSIGHEKLLKIALNSFIHYQLGEIDKAIKVIALSNEYKAESPSEFYHLCKNLEAYLSIQNGDYRKFDKLIFELEALSNKEISHLAPFLESNALYMSNYVKGISLSLSDPTQRHYKNVLLYHKSRELDLLDNLKNSALQSFSEEIYNDIDTYGKETMRFTNVPNSIGNKLTRFVFNHSFFGSINGVRVGQKHLLKNLFVLGVSTSDQVMIKEALKYAVTIGAAKDIEKIVKSPIFHKTKETVSFIEGLISKSVLGGASAIGTTVLIKNCYRYLSSNILGKSVSHIKSELFKGLSFTSDFDHARPAMEAMFFLAHVLPDEKVSVLIDAFLDVIKDLKMNMITSDSINKVINNIPSNYLNNHPEKVTLLMESYLLRVDDFLKMHFETSFLVLEKLTLADKDKKSRTIILNQIREEINKKNIPPSRIIFLNRIEEKINGNLKRESTDLIVSNLMTKFLDSSSDSYSTETFGGIDPIATVYQMFSSIDESLRDEINSKMLSVLFDRKFSISNKVKVLSAFLNSKDFIKEDVFKAVESYVIQNRNALFVSTNNDDRGFSFRTSSFPTYRALLYRCASLVESSNEDMFSLDLLRLSVSTESFIREQFIHASLSFLDSNKSSIHWHSLFNRCYELSFDNDPSVKGAAVAAMIQLFKNSKEFLKLDIMKRVLELTNDPSETVRSNLIYAIKENASMFDIDFVKSISLKLEHDVDFYVRKNARGI